VVAFFRKIFKSHLECFYFKSLQHFFGPATFTVIVKFPKAFRAGRTDNALAQTTRCRALCHLCSTPGGKICYKQNLVFFNSKNCAVVDPF
jgi:hypothetical protein